MNTCQVMGPQMGNKTQPLPSVMLYSSGIEMHVYKQDSFNA